MPFVPFASFDPVAPNGYPLPVLWLRRHARRWAFPAGASPGDVDRYRIWLHVLRTDTRLAARERELRPSIRFRLWVFVHRVYWLLRVMDGGAAYEILRDAERAERQRKERE